MKIKDFKVNDIIKIVIADCCEGEAVVTSTAESEMVCKWLYCSMCYFDTHLENSEFVKITKEDIEKNIADTLELIERPRADKNNYLLTENQIEKLIGSYTANKEELEALKEFINENSITDYGLLDVTESFEQGYNNALRYVFSVLNIPVE